MRFKDIVSRLTGFSGPIFGVSWKPPETDRAIVRRVLASLEDRRVLYSPSSMEIPDHCVKSVLEIRALLTKEIGTLDANSELSASLRALRGACRKFLNTVQADEGRIIRFGAQPGHYANWTFNGALGEMRGVFGVHIAKLAAAYGVDIEGELAAVLPGEDLPDSGMKDGLRSQRTGRGKKSK